MTDFHTIVVGLLCLIAVLLAFVAWGMAALLSRINRPPFEDEAWNRETEE